MTGSESRLPANRPDEQCAEQGWPLRPRRGKRLFELICSRQSAGRPPGDWPPEDWRNVKRSES